MSTGSQPTTGRASRARRFRPMGVADLLDETAELYKRNFVLLVGIAAVLYVPAFLLQGTIEILHSRDPLGSDQSNRLLAFLALYLLLILPTVTGAMTFAISDRYLERKTSIGECYRRVVRPRVFFRLIWAIILKSLLIGVAFLVATAVAVAALGAGASSTVGTGGFGATPQPAIILLGLLTLGVVAVAVAPIYLKLVLTEPALIIESRPAGASIRRSWLLTKGNLGKAFWLLLIVGAVVVIIRLMVTGPTQAIMLLSAYRGQLASHGVLVTHVILATLINCLMAPVGSTAFILLYYDIRIRREGFDLEILAAELDARASESAARQFDPLPHEKPPTEGEPP